MKKVLILVITLAILASLGVAVTAEETEDYSVIPRDKGFSAMVAMERAQGEISEGLPEKALIENDCANKRMAALELAKEQIGDDEFDQEDLETLIGYLNGNEENLGLIIADMARDKENSEIAQTAEDVAKGIEERGWRLEEIVEDEKLPEGAIAGAERALANMEAAAKKAAWARGKGDEGDEGPPGPPPWAGERKENGTNSEGVTTKGEEAPKVPLPDEASEVTPIDEAPPVEAPSEEAPDGENAPEDDPPEGVPSDDASTERPDPAGGPS